MKKETKNCKRKNVKSNIVASLLVCGGVLIGITSHDLVLKSKGKAKIVKSFNESLDNDYFVYNDSQKGYSFSDHDRNYSYEEGLNEIKRDALEDGLTEEEVYIGIKCLVNDTAAQDAMGFQMGISDRFDLYDKSYKNEIQHKKNFVKRK